MPISLTLIFVIVTVLASLYAWSKPDVLQRWLLNPYSVNRHGQYYRFITSGFIHSDYMHLFFNMFALYSFGEAIEQMFMYQFGGLGQVLYALLYLLGIIVSDIPTYLKHRNHPHYNSLGASGGVSSVVFAAILLFPMSRMGIMFIPVRIPAFIFGGLYLLYSYVQAERGGDYINHDAHLYGSIFGLVFTVIAIPASVPNFFQQISNWSLF